MGTVVLFSGLLCAALVASSGLQDLANQWLTDEAYGHGFIVVAISVYLFLTRLPRLAGVSHTGKHWGVVAFAVLMALLVISEAAQIHTLSQYLLTALIASLAVASWGRRALIIVAPSLVLFLFSIPLPSFLQTMLTADLQLLASKIGVWFLMLATVPVYLEGNVIDLGVYKLQVVEACAGLNYLYPLLGIAFICACYLRTPYWQRVLLVFCAVPITVILNSLRIAVAGLLVKANGPEAAAGFMHFFEGWVVFLACLLLLLGVMAGMARFFNGNSLHEDLNIDLKPPRSGFKQLLQTQRTWHLLACAAFAALGLVASYAISDRPERIPSRSALALFPMTLDTWRGTPGSMSPENLKTLGLSDYLLAEYHSAPETQHIELYVAYYDSQKETGGIHSPKVCLPGGGWEINEFETRENESAERTVRLNRAILQKGLERQLVYYWFEQGDNTFANELALKADILRRSFLENATNGALVRISTKIDSREKLLEAESRLNRFFELAAPTLKPYIPH